ncbi:MAG: signal peptidase II [Desulfovibrionaceae bacterium]|nr:signal peptidase II [Desulfovibrionaceae bacterium]
MLLGGIAGVFLLLDQVTKLVVTAKIPEYSSLEIIPGCLNLVNVLNRGAAFGFLNRSDIEWQFWLFLLATFLAVGAILYVARTLQEKAILLPLGLGSILGGALGNLIDRVRMRAVLDFIDVYWRDWHWPAFNVADTGICIGAFLVCYVLFFENKPASARK